MPLVRNKGGKHQEDQTPAMTPCVLNTEECLLQNVKKLKAARMQKYAKAAVDLGALGWCWLRAGRTPRGSRLVARKTSDVRPPLPVPPNLLTEAKGALLHSKVPVAHRRL